MAGGASRPRDQCAKALSRNRTLADCDLFSALSHPVRRAPPQALLRDRIGWNRHRLPRRSDSPGRPGLANPHSEPDGISEQTPTPTGTRKTVSAPRRGSPRGRRSRARHPTQAAVRDQLVYRLIKWSRGSSRWPQWKAGKSHGEPERDATTPAPAQSRRNPETDALSLERQKIMDLVRYPYWRR